MSLIPYKPLKAITKHLLLIIPIIVLIGVAKGQSPIDHPAELFVDSTGQVYTRADQPAYLFIAPESDSSNLVMVPSNDRAANPMQWDGHGVHYIAHKDMELNKTIRFRVLADGMPPVSTLNFESGLLFSMDNIFYAQVGSRALPVGTDAMSGVKQTYISIDGEGFAAINEPIVFSQEKEYALMVYTVDNVGNAEEPKPFRVITSQDATIRMGNIYFGLNSSRLAPDAPTELNKLARLLQQYTGIYLEIAAHTDARGSKDYNQMLSEMRAQAVVSYLVNRGVPKARLGARGYGETMPVNVCSRVEDCTEEQHRANRRVELRISKIQD